jgi:hypothetical protein
MDHSLFNDLALPSLVVQAVFRHLGWTLALAVVLALLMPKRWAQRWWWGLGLGVASNLPILSEVNSALALSFQTPSLLSQGLLACALWRGLRPSAAGTHAPDVSPVPMPMWGWAITALLGWVLLLDTLGWGGTFIYAWGFGPAMPVAVLLGCAAALAWAAWHPQPAHQTRWLWQLAGAMGLFVLTRGPSGNAWDAISDPWLWLVASGLCAAQLWRRTQRRFTRPQSL